MPSAEIASTSDPDICPVCGGVMLPDAATIVAAPGCRCVEARMVAKTDATLEAAALKIKETGDKLAEYARDHPIPPPNE